MDGEYTGVENKCMWDSANKLCAQLRKLMYKYNITHVPIYTPVLNLNCHP